MQTYLTKHLVNKSIALPSLLLEKRKNDWKGKPTTWPDIRKNTQDGHIYLLADARYPIGFTATATGGYNVKIDGITYGIYNSEAQFSMADWTDYTTTEGYEINYPTGATKAHIIDISPQVENEKITSFKHARVDSTISSEAQGTLWIHFNLTSPINLNGMCSPSPYRYAVNFLEAVTAKNNLITFSGLGDGTFRSDSLSYIPVLKNFSVSSVSFFSSAITKVVLNEPTLGISQYSFSDCRYLTDIKIKNPSYSNTGQFGNFLSGTMLKEFPKIDWSKVKQARDMWTDSNRTMNAGKPTIIDARAGNQIEVLGLHDTNTLVGLRVSSEAPFTGSASQINVKNTAMDRHALTQLFNDLPSVSAGQIINIVGCAGTSNLTADDKAIATDKGWTIAE